MAQKSKPITSAISQSNLKNSSNLDTVLPKITNYLIILVWLIGLQNPPSTCQIIICVTVWIIVGVMLQVTRWVLVCRDDKNLCHFHYPSISRMERVQTSIQIRHWLKIVTLISCWFGELRIQGPRVYAYVCFLHDIISRMCLQCGVPKTYSHTRGMVCPICGDRPPADPLKEPEKKKGSAIKDKEKSKRMKGQSSHATWKSETEMQLRQQFD